LKYGQDWKKIAEQIGLKTGKEALLEFLRIKTPELYGSDRFLEMHAQTLGES
jgi:hypothetical protein